MHDAPAVVPGEPSRRLRNGWRTGWKPVALRGLAFRRRIAAGSARLMPARPWLLLLLALAAAPVRADVLPLRTNDVVAVVGGANAVAAAESGHLEALVQAARPGLRLRFRSLAWEGDTVAAQPREVNFPPTPELLAQHGVTVLLVDFGRSEALDPAMTPARFREACAARLDELGRVTPRRVLLTPPPFGDPPGDAGPDLSAARDRLAALAAVVRELAAGHGLPVADVQAGLARLDPARLTTDGVQLTDWAQAQAALVVAAALAPPDGRPPAVDAAGRFTDPDLEAVRQAVIAKNRLWHGYWRPTNWAFLWGDRMEQPSSRDHRDRRVRWFPAEMEEFVPLIREAETRIGSLAAQLR